jgi:hypothetical protein
MYEYIRILLGARPILPISRLKVKPRDGQRERSVFDEAMADLLIYSLVISTSLKKGAFLYLSMTL